VLLAPGARRRRAPEIPGQLRWETQAFRGPLDAVGPLEVALDAATSAFDAAWMVTIHDVAPDGTATSVTERHRGMAAGRVA
jgi:predicted acyl esterase